MRLFIWLVVALIPYIAFSGLAYSLLYYRLRYLKSTQPGHYILYNIGGMNAMKGVS
nr:MAG TPA: protein of unknown function (DUF334) [Caudoviricetes sp.]